MLIEKANGWKVGGVEACQNSWKSEYFIMNVRFMYARIRIRIDKSQNFAAFDTIFKILL